MRGLETEIPLEAGLLEFAATAENFSLLINPPPQDRWLYLAGAATDEAGRRHQGTGGGGDAIAHMHIETLRLTEQGFIDREKRAIALAGNR